MLGNRGLRRNLSPDSCGASLASYAAIIPTNASADVDSAGRDSVKEEVSLVSIGSTSMASSTETLKAGDHAPDFELPGHRGGERFKLSDLRGSRNAVIVFYPLDWTPV
jgi:hypothetical protein